MIFWCLFIMFLVWNRKWIVRKINRWFEYGWYLLMTRFSHDWAKNTVLRYEICQWYRQAKQKIKNPSQLKSHVKYTNQALLGLHGERLNFLLEKWKETKKKTTHLFYELTRQMDIMDGCETDF